MSFERADAGNWIGQTIDVSKLISDGLAVIAQLLTQATSIDRAPAGVEQ